MPYRATTLISSIFRHFRPELRKKSFRSYTGGEKGHFDERVFGDFSKTSYPIVFGLIISEKKIFLEFVGSEGPNHGQPSERQKILSKHLFIQLGRLTVSANLVLSQVDRFQRLYCGVITLFLDFGGTLRSDPPESAKPFSNPP